MAVNRQADGRVVIRRRAWATLALFVLALVALYAAAWTAHLRFDWTEDGVYTLSDATRAVLRRVKEPVRIRAYITSGLPQPYGALRRFITDMLASYHDAAPNISYEVIDPDRDSSAAAALAAMGIPRVQVQVVEDDQAQIKQGYMALVVEYLDKKATIPVVQSESGFEYNLTRRIKQVTGSGKRTIGVMEDDGAIPLDRMGRLRQLAGDDYRFEVVHPEREALPEDLAALIVAGATKPLSTLARYRIEQLRLRGGGLLVLAGNAVPQLDLGFRVQPVDRYANDWLRDDLGVVVRPGLVFDRDAGRVMVNQRQGIFMFRSAVDYPFMPAIHDLNPTHSLTRGLREVAMPFVSPLICSEQAHDCTVLMRSSPASAVQNGPPFDVDPLRRMASLFAGMQRSPQVVGVALGGPLQARLAPPKEGLTDAERKATRPKRRDAQRVVVLGAPALFEDTFMDGDNTLFALNALDWVAGNEGLIALRARQVTQRPLAKLDGDARAMWKVVWIFLLPLLVGIAAVVRWRWRLRAGTVV